jgi:hypothetical protein
MSKLKHKPLTTSLGPFLKEKWYKTTRKQVFMLFFILGPFGHPKMDPKIYSKTDKQAGCMAQCVKLKISPIPNY